MDPIADNPEAAARLREIIALGIDEAEARELVAIEVGFFMPDNITVEEAEAR